MQIQENRHEAGLLVFVAGPGIEPGSGGYEPPEVPLLYPAMYSIVRSSIAERLLVSSTYTV